MSRLTRDGTAEPVSRDQILRRGRGQGNDHFPCSADHEQDWQPYPVDPYSAVISDYDTDMQNLHSRMSSRDEFSCLADAPKVWMRSHVSAKPRLARCCGGVSPNLTGGVRVRFHTYIQYIDSQGCKQFPKKS